MIWASIINPFDSSCVTSSLQFSADVIAVLRVSFVIKSSSHSHRQNLSQLLSHPVGRDINSDKLINNFITVDYENFLFSFNHNFVSKKFVFIDNHYKPVRIKRSSYRVTKHRLACIYRKHTSTDLDSKM